MIFSGGGVTFGGVDFRGFWGGGVNFVKSFPFYNTKFSTILGGFSRTALKGGGVTCGTAPIRLAEEPLGKIQT